MRIRNRLAAATGMLLIVGAVGLPSPTTRLPRSSTATSRSVSRARS